MECYPATRESDTVILKYALITLQLSLFSYTYTLNYRMYQSNILLIHKEVPTTSCSLVGA